MPPCLLFVHTATDDREMYTEYLTGEGFRVVQAETTDAALPLVAEADVVVTGLRVRGSIEPIRLITAIRHDRRTASKPVIVLTAVTFSNEHEHALCAGADVVILKPCLPDALLAAMRRVLEARAADAAR